jgi:hypothetical protein
MGYMACIERVNMACWKGRDRPLYQTDSGDASMARVLWIEYIPATLRFPPQGNDVYMMDKAYLQISRAAEGMLLAFRLPIYFPAS